MAAVGGYGRGELYPYSDIDLLVLTDESVKEDESCRRVFATFTTRLWELGLTVGASVRSTSEFLSEAAEDVSIATTYLESRCLSWGNGRLYAQARMHFAQTLDPRRFFRDKMLELARRHQKFEDTPYSLEPNIKESPGGLATCRSFWCAQAAGIAQSVSDMASAGLITEREMARLVACEHHLEPLRITLYPLTHRPENRLLFDVQEALASALGYSATAQLRPSEALMKRYYLNAKAVVQMSVIQLQAIADRLFGSYDNVPAVRLAAFVARGDEMDIAGDDGLQDRSQRAMLRLFYVYHSHPELTRLSTRLLRASPWHAAPTIDDAFRHDLINQATFLDILRMPKGTYHSLKLMNTWGVLGRFLPPFRHIAGQMQHDPLPHLHGRPAHAQDSAQHPPLRAQ